MLQSINNSFLFFGRAVGDFAVLAFGLVICLADIKSALAFDL